MAFYQTFTSTRTTPPDINSLNALIRSTIGDNSVVSDTIPGQFQVKKNTSFTPSNITTIQNIIDTAPNQSPQLTAQNIIDNMPIFEKALLLTLLDQINVLRTRAGLATISVQQAIQGVRDKAGTL